MLLEFSFSFIFLLSKYYEIIGVRYCTKRCHTWVLVLLFAVLCLYWLPFNSSDLLVLSLVPLLRIFFFPQILFSFVWICVL